MCGIAFYRRKFIGSLEPQMYEDLNKMRKRGPDNLNLKYLDKETAIGHTRLAINGLSKTFNQPYTEDNQNYLIFNGEIYNFRNEDNKFLSDTKYLYENLLNRISSADRLIDFLKRIDGVWAFVFLTKDKVIVSRDTFGEKPLHQHQNKQEGFFSFTSSESTFASQNTDSKEYLPNTLSILSRSDLQVLESRKIHSFKLTREPIQNAVFKAEYHQMIINSVARRADCDVSMACTVSGGLDSSLIAAIMSKTIEKPCTYYTIKFLEDSGEYKYVQYLEDTLGIEVRVCNLNIPDYFKHLSEKYHELPKNINSPSAIAHSLLMKKISDDGFKVCLDGQGADEYLGGYHFQFVEHVMYRLKHRLSIFEGLKLLTGTRKIFSGAMINYAFRILRTRKIQKDMDILCASLLMSPLPSLLSYTDYVSMDNSVEVRTPYLYVDLVKFSLKHNPRQIEPLYSKPVLRQLLQEYQLDFIASRKDKMGYELPWLGMCKYLKTNEGRLYMPEVFRSKEKNVIDIIMYTIFKLCLKLYPKQAMYIYMKLLKKFNIRTHADGTLS